MANWLIKFKGDVWLSVFCETRAEAIMHSVTIEQSTTLVFDHEIVCLG